MLEFSLMSIFAQYNVDRHVLGYKIPAASLITLNPIKEGMLTGIWILFLGFSAILSSYAADRTVTYTKQPAITNSLYEYLFSVLGTIAIGIGIILFFLAPKIKKLII